MIPTVRVSVPEPNIQSSIDAARKASYQNIAIEGMAKFAERQVQLLTPGTGVVRALWTTTYTRDSQGRINQAIIHNTFKKQDVLTFLEGGTKPHKILPKPGNASGLLVFKGDFGWVSSRGVDHPGTRPYRMVELSQTALQFNLRLFMTKFDADIQKGLDAAK